MPPVETAGQKKTGIDAENYIASLDINSSTRSRRASFMAEGITFTAPAKTETAKKPVIIYSNEEKREIEEMFNLFDTDGSGTMEVEELEVVLWAMGLMII